MSVLLVSPAKATIYGLPGIPRLGLAYLSASLMAKGIEHDVLELGLDGDDWKRALRATIGKFSSFGSRLSLG